MKRITLVTAAVLAIVVVGSAFALYSGAGWVDVGMGALMLANAPGGIELKQIEDLVDKATKAVKATTDRMQQALDQAINDVKKLETVTGKSNDELAAASKAAKESQDGLKAIMDRVLEIEQKAAKRTAGGDPEAGKSWGEIVAGSEQYKNASGKNGKGKPEMDPVEVGSWHKTRILSSDVSATGTVPMLTQADRVSGVFTPPERQLVVRSLIPVMSTESSLIEFCRELLFTNSAAPQGSGSSPDQTEAQVKAESGITFEFVQQAIITLAHWIPASRQILQDAKMLASYIDQRLRYGVLLEEEDEVLNSTGTNGELNGLWNQATAYNRDATADSPLDQLLKAFLQVTLSDYAADGSIMSWVDWTNLLLMKDTQGRYLFSDPQGVTTPRIWGRPVVPTNSMTAGRFIVGAFQLAAALWDREQANVRVAEQHSDFFVRNMVVILAEERIALTVYRPQALVKGTFRPGAGQPS
jgi:HK97 family phage major capsid protein